MRYIPKAVIIDIDGCLVDNAHYIYPKDKTSREEWGNFEKFYINYKFNTWCLELIENYSKQGYKILFVTAREATDNGLNLTRNMLDKIWRVPDYQLNDLYHLFMRPFDNYEDSDKVKKDIYTSSIKGRFDIKLAVDDEIKNIKMWNSLGITTLHSINNIKEEV